MKLLPPFSLCLFSAILFLGSETIAQETVFGPQVIPESAALLVPADPFVFSVALQPDGSLLVSPEWATQSGALSFSQMQRPPSIRTISEGGFLIGEFALKDGTWSPLFSVADLSAIPPPISEPGSVLPHYILSATVGNAVPQKDSLANPASPAGASIDVFATGASDPAFPKDVPKAWLQAIKDRKLEKGHRQFFVNNVSGDDTSEGVMLHPQLGSLKKSGPLRSLTAARKKMQSGDEIVLVGTGTAYHWESVSAATSNLVITPVGTVTLEP